MANAAPLLPSAAVVLAHGPAGATLTTLNRASTLVGEQSPVIVVGAIEPGLDAIQRAAERGYTTVHDHGPVALQQVLLGLEGTVLVLHDDVVVTTHSVASMMAAHLTTGLTTVPGPNGSAGRAGTSKNREQRRVEEADLACVLGDAAALAELAEASAFGPGMRPAGDFVQAGNSESVHTADCQQRFCDGRSEAAPLLVAALIVRDESEHLAECLKSLDGIVDRIEVADTGSVDDTAHIARSHGATVLEIGWRDDFAWARNQVLDQCRDAAFVLWIDADERFRCADPERFRNVLRTYARLYPSYRLEIHNYSDNVETHSFWAKRIVDPTGVQFEGALHEQARRVDGGDLLEVTSGLCSIDHLGYAQGEMAARSKLERNLRIAEESFHKESTPERAVHYARALEAASTDPGPTLARIGPLLDLVGDAPIPIRAMLIALRGKLLLEMGELDRAAEVAEEAARMVPADAVAGAVLAAALVGLGRQTDALEVAGELAAATSLAPTIVDRVAAQTRARTLFRAALTTSQIHVAMAGLGDLASQFDPWPELAAAAGTGEIVHMAHRAGEVNDDRFLQALIDCEDISFEQISEARDEFFEGGGTLLDSQPLDAALVDLRLVAEAPDLRARFDTTGDLTDAAAYAAALAAGQIDLTVELESVSDHPHGVAIALAVGAEALRRRGRSDEAVADAIAAAERWPGALRAALIVAEAATASGSPQIAIDMVAAADQAGALEGASAARRHELINRTVEAYLALDDLASAAGAALVIIEQRGHLEAWPAMLELAVANEERMAVVLGLALVGDGNDFLTAAAATLPTEKTAELCLAFLMLGGLNPEAVTTGLLAAMLRERVDLAELLADFAHLLDEEVRNELAARLVDMGADTVADKLAQSVVSA